MGKFSVVPKNTFDALQVDAGVLLWTFDPDNPVAPKDEDIICATTGGINTSCVPTYSDYGEDVDNVPVNMMELKHLDSWECKISTSCLGTSAELIRLTLGAADIDGVTKIIPRRDLNRKDFRDLWWVGDKANGGLVAVQIKNALSTGGFSLQSTKNGKGTVTLEITGHVSIDAQKEVPMIFYSIDVDSFNDVTVTAENPATKVFTVDTSDIQTDVVVANGAVTGTLHYLTEGNPITDYWGEGHFLVLKFADLDPDATSVKVGLDPSESSGLVELINDPDKNGVFKITNKDKQMFVVVSSDVEGNSHTQAFDLAGLTLEPEA